MPDDTAAREAAARAFAGVNEQGWEDMREHERTDARNTVSVVLFNYRAVLGDQPMRANLGLATSADLLDEVRARIEVAGLLEYRTVDELPYTTPTAELGDRPVLPSEATADLYEITRAARLATMQLIAENRHHLFGSAEFAAYVHQRLQQRRDIP